MEPLPEGGLPPRRERRLRRRRWPRTKRSPVVAPELTPAPAPQSPPALSLPPPAARACGGLPDGAVIGRRWRLWQRQRASSVGLDIGAGSLKLVQVGWRRGRPRLENLAVVPLTPGAIEEGLVAWIDDVGQILRRTVAALGQRQRQVGFSVGSQAVLTRWFSLPELDRAELADAVRWEIPHHFPGHDNMIYDFTAVPEARTADEEGCPILVVGAQRRLVDGYLQVARAAGLQPQVIEPDCLATLRALQWTGRIEPAAAEPLVIIDLGRVGTRLSIVRYCLPVLARTISLGTAGLAEMVAHQLEAAVGVVEQRICAEGLLPGSAVAVAAEPWLNQMVEAVARSIEFFVVQHRGVYVERVFLAGGGALLPGMAEALAERVSRTLGQRVAGAPPCQVEVADLGRLEMAPGLAAAAAARGPALAAALGAALREGARR